MEKSGLIKKREKLVIRNKGTDILKISSFNIGNAVFGASQKTLEIAPNTEEELVLSASPKASGNFKSFLTISSNDSNQPNVKVNLEVNAVTPPSLVIQPLNIEYKLEPKQ